METLYRKFWNKEQVGMYLILFCTLCQSSKASMGRAVRTALGRKSFWKKNAEVGDQMYTIILTIIGTTQLPWCKSDKCSALSLLTRRNQYNRHNKQPSANLLTKSHGPICLTLTPFSNTLMISQNIQVYQGRYFKCFNKRWSTFDDTHEQERLFVYFADFKRSNLGLGDGTRSGKTWDGVQSKRCCRHSDEAKLF